MSLQVNIKNNEGTQTITSLTGISSATLNTKNKYINDYIVVEVAHNTEDATASASDILSGQTAYISDGSKATGAMTNNGAVSATITTATGSYTIPAGYHNGSGSVSANIPVYDYSYTLPCLCFTANTSGSTVAMSVNGTPTLGQNFQTSTDGQNWSDFIPGTTTITLANVGDKIYFKGDNPNGINEYANEVVYQFVMTGSIAASGNIMSLIDNGTCNCTALPNEACFAQLFMQCEALTSAPQLPATTLTANCYLYMFGMCTGLTSAPQLPSETLQTSCYYAMFFNCSNLVTAPSLPATALVENCYGAMFYGCSSLIVSDTSSSGYSAAWTIPSAGTFVTVTDGQPAMFNSCATGAGRASDNFVPTAGSSYTYYTQNTPI